MKLENVLNRNWKVLLLFFLYWFGLLAATGTLTSGFHFTDDHDLLRINEDISKTTIQRETGIFLKDLFQSKMRFRPFFMLHRRAATAVLGTNFIAWSVYFGLLAVLTSFFLFLFARRVGFPPVESCLFSGLTLLGTQAAIWWKLGANETIGMFVLSIAMLMMALSVYGPDKRKTLYNILFIGFTVLATWSKESFILMIPALVVWQILLIYQKEREIEAATFRGSVSRLIRTVRRNWLAPLTLSLIFIATLLHILFKVGTTGIQYAGYEGFSLSRFFGTVFQSMGPGYGLALLAQLILIGVLLFKLKKSKQKQSPGLSPDPPDSSAGLSSSSHPRILSSSGFLVSTMIVVILIVLPQIVLYMKSGIIERYLLPAVLGYALLLVTCVRYARTHSKSSRGPGIFALLILLILCLHQMRVTRYTAISFTYEGQHTNAWFESIEKNTNPDDHILVITHPVTYLEPSVAFKTYSDLKLNRRHTVFTPATVKLKETGLWQTLNSDYFSNFTDTVLKETAAVAIFPDLEDEFLKHAPPWFDTSRYKRYTNEGGFVIYFK